MEPQAKIYSTSRIHMHELCAMQHTAVRLDRFVKHYIGCRSNSEFFTRLLWWLTKFYFINNHSFYGTWTHQWLPVCSISAVFKQCFINSPIDKNCNICSHLFPPHKSGIIFLSQPEMQHHSTNSAACWKDTCSTSSGDRHDHSYVLGMTLNCIHIFIVTGSFLYWCVMWPASQHFFIHSCIYLPILIISYLATFLGTNSLSVLMCRKAVNQSWPPVTSISSSLQQITLSLALLSLEETRLNMLGGESWRLSVVRMWEHTFHLIHLIQFSPASFWLHHVRQELGQPAPTDLSWDHNPSHQH